MSTLVRIVQNTPWWAFGLLALVVVLGIQALRPRTIAVWRLLAIPGVFIAWGLLTLATRSVGAPILLLDWFVAGTAGMAIGWQTTRLNGMAFDRGRGLVTVSGSSYPLLRNVSIFLVKYCLAAAIAVVPARRAGLLPWDVAVSGLAAGYFIGWLVRLARKFRGMDAIGPLTTQ